MQHTNHSRWQKHWSRDCRELHLRTARGANWRCNSEAGSSSTGRKLRHKARYPRTVCRKGEGNIIAATRRHGGGPEVNQIPKSLHIAYKCIYLSNGFLGPGPFTLRSPGWLQQYCTTSKAVETIPIRRQPPLQ